MKIAIPNSVENGIHQMVKVALSSMVALFGTYQIAANGMAQNIWSLASIVALSMSPVYTTVIGQCMGANDIDAANFYFKKLNKITLISSLLWNAFVFAITPLIVSFTAVSAETKTLIIWLVLTNNIFNGLFFTYAATTGKRSACSRRCQIYDGYFGYIDDCNPSVFLCTVWYLAAYGGDRCSSWYEYRSWHTWISVLATAAFTEMDKI